MALQGQLKLDVDGKQAIMFASFSLQLSWSNDCLCASLSDVFVAAMLIKIVYQKIVTAGSAKMQLYCHSVQIHVNFLSSAHLETV